MLSRIAQLRPRQQLRPSATTCREAWTCRLQQVGADDQTCRLHATWGSARPTPVPSDSLETKQSVQGGSSTQESQANWVTHSACCHAKPSVNSLLPYRASWAEPYCRAGAWPRQGQRAGPGHCAVCCCCSSCRLSRYNGMFYLRLSQLMRKGDIGRGQPWCVLPFQPDLDICCADWLAPDICEPPVAQIAVLHHMLQRTRPWLLPQGEGTQAC